MKKFDIGIVSMIMGILGGALSFGGGILSTIDAKRTAIQTAHDTTIEYLNTATKTEEA